MSRRMWRKTVCKGCGFTQETTTSYYLDRKQWQANHLAYHLSVLPVKSQTPIVVSK
jgi:hypothetical protein